MLHHARQATVANQLAPAQTRRSVGTATIRGLFAPSIVLWLHPAGSPVATGTAVGSVVNYGGGSATITQATASKQPLKSANKGVPSFAFDGVNDCLSTSAIDLTGTTAITVAYTQIRTLVIGGITYEVSTDQNVSVFGAIVYSDANDNVGVHGNVGYNSRTWVAFGLKWYGVAASMDKSQAGATEVIPYRNGGAPTITSSSLDNNTNSFGNVATFIGARNNGASVPFQGNIGQLIVLKRALSTSQTALLSQLIGQATGIA